MSRHFLQFRPVRRYSSDAISPERRDFSESNRQVVSVKFYEDQLMLTDDLVHV